MKAGDVVRLKSGGPWMTISSSTASPVYTSWFDGQILRQGVFSLHELELRSEPEVAGKYVKYCGAQLKGEGGN